MKPSERVYGVNVQQIETGHGVFMLVRDWMLEDGVTGGNGFAGMAFAVDLDEIEYFYLNENGLNRDTHITENAVVDGADRIVDEILTEGGFAIHQEKYHAKLYNVTDYSA
jgi:hypothetical protein